tara:strand:- start:928 stop:1227 length:300 start_codon:yes stop_codon:yes gene_type:complete
MNNLLCLTEIYVNSSEYSNEKKDVIRSFSLRKAYINPSQICVMREDEGMGQRCARGELVDGLHEHHKFSKIYFGSSSTGVTSLTVVGEPDDILQKIARL